MGTELWWLPTNGPEKATCSLHILRPGSWLGFQKNTAPLPPPCRHRFRQCILIRHQILLLCGCLTEQENGSTLQTFGSGSIQYTSHCSGSATRNTTFWIANQKVSALEGHPEILECKLRAPKHSRLFHQESNILECLCSRSVYNLTL